MNKDKKKHNWPTMADERPARCPDCHGTGKCPICHGKGCMSCDYIGDCDTCSGSGNKKASQ